MKTRRQLIEEWNIGIKKPGFKGEPHLFEVLLDIRELLMEERKGCENCGLAKKYWNKNFCQDGQEHK